MKTKIFQNIIKNDENDFNRCKKSNFHLEKVGICSKIDRTKLLAEEVERTLEDWYKGWKKDKTQEFWRDDFEQIINKLADLKL